MLGFPHINEARVEDAFARIHREDFSRVRGLYEAAFDPEGNGRLDMEFRFVRPGGEVRWMAWSVAFTSTCNLAGASPCGSSAPASISPSASWPRHDGAWPMTRFVTSSTAHRLVSSPDIRVNPDVVAGPPTLRKT